METCREEFQAVQVVSSELWMHTSYRGHSAVGLWPVLPAPLVDDVMALLEPREAMPRVEMEDLMHV